MASLAVSVVAIALVAIFYPPDPGGRTVDVLGVHAVRGSMSFSLPGVVWWFLGLPVLSLLLSRRRHGLHGLHH